MRRPSGGRRPGAAALAAAGVLGLLLVGVPAAAQTPSPRADNEAPVGIVVQTLAPRAPRDPGGYLQVAGTLTNRGDVALSSLQVRLKVGEVITNRGGLAQADREGSPTVRRGLATPAQDGQLAPGATTRFDVRVRVGELRLRQLGAYPLDVEARAVVGDGGRLETVGLASTYLPSFTGQAKTRIAWLWPLVDLPRSTPDGRLVDEELARSVVPGGRLERLTAGARTGSEGACDTRPAAPPGQPPAPAAPPCRAEPVPLTYAVDPGLLSDLTTMAAGYQVRTGARTRPGTGAAAALAWLDDLRRDLARPGAAVLSLPWGDPDVVALARRPALRDEVQSADRLGRVTTQDALEREPLRGAAWPPAGPLTGEALDTVTGGDTSAVVLDAVALVDSGRDVGRTPSARAALRSAVSGPVTGLVVEPALSQLVDPDRSAWSGPRLAEQRWLVETAMIAAERPNEARTLLVAPPRRADLDPALAAAVLADTGRVPWLCPVALAAVLTGREACPGEAAPAVPRLTEDRGTLEPPVDASDELSQTALRTVERVRSRSAQLTDRVLDAASPAAVDTRARLLRARLRTESSAWRGDPAAGRRLLGLYSADVDGLRKRLRVSTGQKVTLTSDKGVVRVTIVNELDQPVTLGVRLSASNAARLSTETTDVITVGRRNSRPLDVRVTAQTSGQFVVFAQLVDRDLQPFGEPAELVVRSTQYGRVALGVTGVGVAVLLVTVGVRIVRRALGRRGVPPAAEPAG